MSNESKVPLWRQILRGFSQCAFQANEITGIVFVIAVAIFDWRMATYYILSVSVGTLAARALKGIGALMDLGLYGFNSGLLALALGTFFQSSSMLWLWIVVLAVIAAALAVVMSKWLPVPFLSAPFILTLWAIWPFAETLGLTKVDFGAFPPGTLLWAHAILTAIGGTLFDQTVLGGVLFICGVAFSNWRHAVVAVLAAFVADAIAAQAGVPGGAINSGFVGFNAVLAALAAYSLIAEDLRLVVLASLLATWLGSYVNRSWPVPMLASGFVVSIWLILLFGWLNPWFAAKPALSKASVIS